MIDNGAVAANVHELLHSMGAEQFPHGNGRSLYDHLAGTHAILQCWSQPDWICDAGALHSIYGTEVYQLQLAPMARRCEIQAAVGPRAERLAYLFGIVPRIVLFQEIESRGGIPAQGLRVECQIYGAPLIELISADEAASLLVLHMANTVEQSCAADGSPGLHLAEVSRLCGFLNEMGAGVPPLLDECSQSILPEDESAARDAYMAGLNMISTDRSAAVGQFTQATLLCPWVAEPAVWLAYLSLQQGDHDEAQSRIEHARKLLLQWGAAWDKRLSYKQWFWLVDFVAAQAANPEVGPLPAPDDPRNLRQFLDQLEERNWVRFSLGSRTDTVVAETGVVAGPAIDRFHRYIASFAEPDFESCMKIYPGLEAKAWHEAGAFPLAQALEAEFPAICREIRALDEARFTPEIEPIRRTGSWNVLFFHERGRRNEDVCARCPVTARVIETQGAVRTLAGLSYVSRLAPGTHVAPHYGPTNLRLRCHLAITVPVGNCGIRVDSQTRQWKEGKCLVFDDFLLHEAWNHTNSDRVVLIVDVWHPSLSDEEVALLTGLHRYAAAQAASLQAYWSANEKARAVPGERHRQSC